ncbi:uncharacterized protein C5L36_0B07300 [Pichia kudriavzevii]|uniref:Endoplasmic reticulum membrane protein 65 n=1 Tax=Pichia kudriavzevii TaxID=4909 RepID=A0A2U9R2C7_PICKU|nr:uncharacterized protein C5L36_0B07300 [Pichia kudriavzevii]AWU75477.1 hypothetical protein C5L36_0B07300 [Pichia kudriavzevii]
MGKKTRTKTVFNLLLDELLPNNEPKPTKVNDNGVPPPDLSVYTTLPMEIESFMLFGLVYATTVFLQRLVVIPTRWLVQTLSNRRGLNYIRDTISISLISIALLLLNIDTSRIYHNIRSGTAIKLYFMMQVLDVADRLLSVTGKDISTWMHSCTGAKFYLLYSLSALYLVLHSWVLVYQVMALNVAINSYSNVLLTLILSNQFSELKSAVFKRIQREGLFQMSCADLNERFILFIMVTIITSRNILQVSGSPKSWPSLLIQPSILVFGSEVIVDWLKHAYIVRFNTFSPQIYTKFTTILASDFLNNKSFTRRTGFPMGPAIIVLLKLTIFPYISITPYITIPFIPFIVLLLILVRMALSHGLRRCARKLRTKPCTEYIPGLVPNVQLSQVHDVKHILCDLSKGDTNSRPQRAADPCKSEMKDVGRYEMADKRIW